MHNTELCVWFHIDRTCIVHLGLAAQVLMLERMEDNTNQLAYNFWQAE